MGHQPHRRAVLVQSAWSPGRLALAPDRTPVPYCKAACARPGSAGDGEAGGFPQARHLQAGSSPGRVAIRQPPADSLLSQRLAAATRLAIDRHPPPGHDAGRGSAPKGGDPGAVGAGPGRGGWRCGRSCCRRPSPGPPWSAKVRETLFVDGSASPPGALDRRLTPCGIGFSGRHFRIRLSEPRHDEVVSAGIRLHEATAALGTARFSTKAGAAVDGGRRLHGRRPGSLGRPTAAHPAAGRAAASTRGGPRRVGRTHQSAGTAQTGDSPANSCSDLYGTVLFVAPPLITITPVLAPALWAAGWPIVDALSWGEGGRRLDLMDCGVGSIVAGVDVRLGVHDPSAFHAGGVPRTVAHRCAGADGRLIGRRCRPPRASGRARSFGSAETVPHRVEAAHRPSDASTPRPGSSSCLTAGCAGR